MWQGIVKKGKRKEEKSATGVLWCKEIFAAAFAPSHTSQLLGFSSFTPNEMRREGLSGEHHYLNFATGYGVSDVHQILVE